MNSHSRASVRRAPGAAVAAMLALLLSALFCAPVASGATQPLSEGEVRLTLNGGVNGALRQGGVKLKAIKPAELAGHKLNVPVSSGSFDIVAGHGVFQLVGGLVLRDGRQTIALRQIRLNTAGKRLSAIVAGKRVPLTRLAGTKLTDDGFGVRLEASRLPLTRAGAATLNRVLALPDVLRPGRSLGSINGSGEPSSVDIASGTIVIGDGPETTLSRLASIEVDMGLWGGSERFGEADTFLFPVEPTTVGIDATNGIVAGEPNAGITFQIHASPPRNMLLRGLRIDLATGELTATVSALSTQDPVTATIATLDYSNATFQVRRRVGAFELMGIRAVATPFIADQLNARFETPGMFQAGETFARVTVNLDAVD